MTGRYWKTLSLMVICLALIATSCTTGTAPSPSAGAAKEPKKLEKLKVGYASLAGSYLPLMVTKEAGIFEKYGLDVELALLQGGIEMKALLAGEVPIVGGSGTSAVSAMIEGGDIVIVATAVNVPVFKIMANPSITKPEQLKGKTLAVSKLGTSSHLAAKIALSTWGMNPDKDVTIIAAGGMPEALAAMQGGAAQAASISDPTSLRAKKLGFHELIDLGTSGKEYAHSGYNVTKSYLAQHEDIVRNFITAYVEGTAYMIKNRKFALDVMKKWLKIDDQDVLEGSFDLYGNKYIQKAPYPTISGIQAVLEDLAATNPKAKTADPKKMIDDRFVRQLDESGFIKKLYAQ